MPGDQANVLLTCGRLGAALAKPGAADRASPPTTFTLLQVYRENSARAVTGQTGRFNMELDGTPGRLSFEALLGFQKVSGLAVLIRASTLMHVHPVTDSVCAECEAATVSEC